MFFFFHSFYWSSLTDSFSAWILQEVERDVKERTRGEMGAAKSLCSPFDQPELPEGINPLISCHGHLSHYWFSFSHWRNFKINISNESTRFWFYVVPWILLDVFFLFKKKKQLQVPHALLLESQQRNGPTGAGVTRSSGPCAIFNFHIVRISGAYVLQFGHTFK